ncbi:hypothetical protein PVAP13_2NG531403 [Panicum virgatum]|uniref:Uncharacterized protein n=1 Tax=Panicum virgatum TaxID=38727 RepID=A0A8T0W2C2_PANVG|nr:hypothetical protein PVAP13_2NG531403 [Panicum virgatum]
MPLLHLSLPPHRLLVAGRGGLYFPPVPRHTRVSVRAAAGAWGCSRVCRSGGLRAPLPSGARLPPPRARRGHCRRRARLPPLR